MSLTNRAAAQACVSIALDLHSVVEHSAQQHRLLLLA